MGKKSKRDRVKQKSLLDEAGRQEFVRDFYSKISITPHIHEFAGKELSEVQKHITAFVSGGQEYSEVIPLSEDKHGRYLHVRLRNEVGKSNIAILSTKSG